MMNSQFSIVVGLNYVSEAEFNSELNNTFAASFRFLCVWEFCTVVSFAWSILIRGRCECLCFTGMDFHELLDIPQGDRRKYHDDVTVMVISLEGRIWKSSGKYL